MAMLLLEEGLMILEDACMAALRSLFESDKLLILRLSIAEGRSEAGGDALGETEPAAAAADPAEREELGETSRLLLLLAVKHCTHLVDLGQLR